MKNSPFDLDPETGFDKAEEVASQPLNDLLSAEEVQAVKDAMWITEKAIDSLLLNSLQNSIAKRSVRDLHKLLDRVGT